MSECTRCGDCCRAEPCHVVLSLCGYVKDCPFLCQVNGIYSCGLVESDPKYADMLAIGRGCGEA